MNRFHLSHPVKILWVLSLALFLLALGQSCTRNISVAPVPAALNTRTPTFTVTPSPSFTSTITSTCTTTWTFTLSPTRTTTSVPTATLSFTSTETLVPTETSTLVPTGTFTGIPTDTPVNTPTETPAFVPVCTITPVAATYLTELEPVGSGGATTGTNDSCATAENIGTITAGTDVVVTGSLASTGGGSWDRTKDQDMFFMTAGSAGTYYITVDCFSSGTDNNLLNIDILNASTCSLIYQSGEGNPVVSVWGPMAEGQTYIFVVYGYDGTAPLSYRLTFTPPPPPPPTETPTETMTPCGFPGDTCTPTETLTQTETMTPCGFPGDTCTPTETPVFVPVCTVTPVSATYYTELEPVGSGGATTGTNDSCATGENPGVVSSGGDLVITGSLASSGGASFDFNEDQDFYLFTAGSDGIYYFYLDCFSSGSDNNLLDIFIWSSDGSCSYIYDAGYGPAVTYVYTPPLTAGDSFYIGIFAYDGSAPIPYRLTLVPP